MGGKKISLDPRGHYSRGVQGSLPPRAFDPCGCFALFNNLPDVSVLCPVCKYGSLPQARILIESLDAGKGTFSAEKLNFRPEKSDFQPRKSVFQPEKPAFQPGEPALQLKRYLFSVHTFYYYFSAVL